MFATAEHMLHTLISTGTLKHMTPQNPDEVDEPGVKPYSQSLAPEITPDEVRMKLMKLMKLPENRTHRPQRLTSSTSSTTSSSENRGTESNTPKSGELHQLHPTIHVRTHTHEKRGWEYCQIMI